MKSNINLVLGSALTFLKPLYFLRPSVAFCKEKELKNKPAGIMIAVIRRQYKHSIKLTMATKKLKFTNLKRK